MNDAQKFILLTGAVVTGTYLFTVIAKGSTPPTPPPDVDPTKITTFDLNGNLLTEYSNPTGAMIQTAILEVESAGGGDIWLPQATLSVSSHLKIRHDHVGLHGWGPDLTIINFTSSSFGFRIAKNPDLSPDTLFQYGISDIHIDGFKFTNGAMWATIIDGLTLYNLYAEDVHMNYTFRINCPYATKSCTNLWIEDCHVNRCSSYGFVLNCTTENGCVFDNITFKNCTATKAGCYEWGSHGNWSPGFDFAEGFSVPGGNGYMTTKNLTVDHCEAYECWESGFHTESKPSKINWHFIDCISNNNGQKYIRDPDGHNQGGSWWDGSIFAVYGAGWLVSYNQGYDSGMVFTNCTADGNGAWGWRMGNSSYTPVFENCAGDTYSSSDTNGNGRGTIPIMGTNCGGCCRKAGPCTCVQNTSPC